MSAGRICTRVIATASPTESIRAAAERMAMYDVGSLVVLDGGRRGRAVGMVTDRDIVLRCVAKNIDPDQGRVSQVMTTPVQTVDRYTSIAEAVSQMANAGTRRLLVTGDAEGVVGVAQRGRRVWEGRRGNRGDWAPARAAAAPRPRMRDRRRRRRFQVVQEWVAERRGC